MTDWLTPKQVAVEIGRHRDTVLRALEAGELHGHQRTRRGRWLIAPAAVDAWIQGLDGSTACGCSRLRLARTA
jgi:excisionase family DNA binding protein